MSGTPYNAVVRVPERAFLHKSGSLKKYIKISDNGNPRVQMFCPECGNQIYATVESDKPDSAEKIIRYSFRHHKSDETASPKPANLGAFSSAVDQ